MERLTEDVRRQLLEQNDGFTIQTHYEAKNFRESRTYAIADGQLTIRSTGKTSWADSRFDNNWVADKEEVHRFLYNHRGMLDNSGVVAAKAIQPPSPRLVPIDVPIPPVADPHIAADVIDDTEESNRTFLEQLTPAEKALLLAAVALAAVGIWAAIHYGKPLWRNKVKPAVARLRAKLTKPSPDETTE